MKGLTGKAITPPHVLHISHLYPSEEAPYLGTFIKELHEALLSHSVPTEILIPTPYAFPFSKRWYINHSDLLNEHARRVPYFSIPRRKYPAITKRNLTKAILPVIRASDFDLIHLHWAFPETLILPEIAKLDLPVVLTLHGHLFSEVKQNSSLASHLETALEKADLILTVGEQLRLEVITSFPHTEAKCIHLPNGIDQEKFIISDKEKARNGLGWSPSKRHLLCVANIAEEKGIDVLVESFLKDNIPDDVQLHIIGRVIDQHLLDKCQKLIPQNRSSKITFHGPVSHEALISYYSAANAFILPSRNEGFGVALVEAGMCGLPLISTTSGGPQQIITPETGLIVEKEDPRQLSEAIVTIFSDLNTFDPAVIRTSMINRYAQTRVTSRLIELYEALLT